MPAPRHRTTGSCLHLSLSSAGRIGRSLQSKEKGAKMKEEERREEEEERGQEEDDVVDLFLSTADLKRQAASPRPQTAEGRRVGRAGFHGDETEGTRRRHEEIVRKILEEFDLEATKKKYRSFDAVEMQITGSRYFIGFFFSLHLSVSKNVVLLTLSFSPLATCLLPFLFVPLVSLFLSQCAPINKQKYDFGSTVSDDLLRQPCRFTYITPRITGFISHATL